MRIRRVVLHGFKSFPARTTLSFGDGISGIVGPNGCGKSNVVDALRWVLGEASPRSLRGTEMSDVIFGGAAEHAAQSSAEVRVVFSADGGEAFPGAYEGAPELELCRRAHRDGGSDYEINGSRVRRRDVTELLLDAGIGAGHAFVEQGRVDRLVHANAMERRVAIDDLAGVSAWRARRDEALERLAATSAQLDRAADLAEELGRQALGLQTAAVAALRWKRWRARLRQVEIAVSLVRTDERTRDRRALGDRVRAAQEAMRQAERVRTQREAEALSRDELCHVAEALAESARDAAHAAELTAREASAMEQGARTAEELAQSAVAAAEAAMGADERATTALRASLSDQEEAVRKAEAARAIGVGERTVAEGIEANARIAAEGAASALSEAEGARDAIRAEAARSAAEKALWEGQAVALQGAEVEATEEERAGAQGVLRAALGERDRCASAESAAAILVSEAEAIERVARSDLDRREAQRDSAMRDRAAALSRIDGALAKELADLRDAGRRAIAGAQRALEAAEGSRRAEAVAAAQTRLLEAEEVARAARSAAGDARAQAERLAAAHAGCQAELGELASRGDGGVAERMGGPVARVGDRLDAADPRREALDPWLEAPIVPDDAVDRWVAGVRDGEWVAVLPASRWDAWLAAIAEREGGGWVDPAGLVRRGRSPVGLRREALRARLEGLAADLAVAQADVATLDAASVDGARAEDEARAALARAWSDPVVDAECRMQVAAAVDAAREAEEAAIARGAAARAEIAAGSGDAPVDRAPWQAAAASLARHRTEAAEATAARHHADARVRAAEDGIAALRARTDRAHAAAEARSQLQARIDESAPRRAEIQRRLAEADDACGRAKRAVDDAAVAFRVASEARAAAVATEAGLNAAAEAARAGAGRTADALASAVAAQADSEARWRTAATARTEAADRAAAWLAERRRVDALSDAAAAASIEARSQAAQARASAAASTAALEAARTAANQATERCAVDEADLETAVQEIEALRGAMADRYQVSLSALLDRLDRGPIVLEPDPAVAEGRQVGGVFVEGLEPLTLRRLGDPAEVAGWVAGVREARDALDGLGEVHLGALDAYQEVAGRHADLEQQRRDLEQSVNDLRAAIARLNRECRERFRVAFDRIDAALREVYPRLVGGGAARLVLDDTDDVLDAGVALWVQPPGKRSQHLSLLSGGEKAMAAIALLIALFRFRPSSFCVLDEVDAPLDEANGARFTALLREMARETQILVVTHHRRTMEAADVLYGVSMAPPGVSRIVSVRLGTSDAATAG